MRVLISAFTCNPFGGSEPGAGWAWSAAAAQENEVHVVTRRFAGDRLEEMFRRAGLAVDITYLESPPWIRRVFRGGLGLRLSYVAWQRRLARVARELHAENPFDVVHHVTFANVWLPTGLAGVPAPLVLGPVGGGPQVPMRLWPYLGIRGAVTEAVRRSAQLLSRLRPSVRRGWSRAAVILVLNLETQQALPARYRSKCRVRHHAAASVSRSSDAAHVPAKRAVFAGRLVAWKGARVAVEAIARLPGWELTIVGSGPYEPSIHRAVRGCDLDGRVVMHPWMERRALHDLIENSDVVVVPSLRDDSPFIVAEAQSLGVPVAGFLQGGLRTFASLDGTRMELAPLSRSTFELAQGLAAAIERASELERPLNVERAFGLAGIREDLKVIYETAVDSNVADHIGPMV